MIRHVMEIRQYRSAARPTSYLWMGILRHYDYVDQQGRALQRKYGYFGNIFSDQVGQEKREW